MTGSHHGGAVGRKVAELVAEHVVKARAAGLPHEHEHAYRARTAWMERLEREVAPVMAPIFAEALADPETPDEWRDLFAEVSGPEHQTGILLQIAMFAGLAIAGGPAAAAGAIANIQALAFARKPSVPLTPPEAALAVIRGVMSAEEGQAEARFSGIDQQRFTVMERITGEPPGPQELQEAFRRGIIDQATFEHGIRQSRLRDEWIPTLLALRHFPPSPQAAIEAAVEGHLSVEEAKKVTEIGGLDPAYFDPLYETAGSPPGTEEMIHLWRRGEMTEAEVRQGIRESRVKNKYVDAILKTKRVIPPMRTVVAGVHQGVFTAEVALHKLAQLGYEAEDAAALVQEGQHLATAKVRELTVAEISTLYEEEAITREEASAMLLNLRYDDHHAAWVLDLADTKRARKFLEAAVSRIHTLYVAHKTTPAQVATELDALHVPTTQRAALLHLWDLEREANARPLTLAQLEKAYKNGLIDEPAFIAHLRGMGYTAEDANLIRDLTVPPA